MLDTVLLFGRTGHRGLGRNWESLCKILQAHEWRGAGGSGAGACICPWLVGEVRLMIYPSEHAQLSDRA